VVIALLLACGLAATSRPRHGTALPTSDAPQETKMSETSQNETAQIETSHSETTMSETAQQQRILVHLTHGPEHPTRAALAFNVARAGLQQGHDVTLFLAGDAVQLIRGDVLDHLA